MIYLIKHSMLNVLLYLVDKRSTLAFLIGTYLAIMQLIYSSLKHIRELPEGSFRYVHRAAPYVSETTL